MKTFKRAEVDELPLIEQTANFNSIAFQELVEKKDFEAVKNFFEGSKSLLQKIDKQMIEICMACEDQLALASWAARMGTVGKHLDTIERNLPHANHRLFDWENVIRSMGIILAFRVGAEQTIAINS